MPKEARPNYYLYSNDFERPEKICNDFGRVHEFLTIDKTKLSAEFVRALGLY